MNHLFSLVLVPKISQLSFAFLSNIQTTYSINAWWKKNKQPPEWRPLWSLRFGVCPILSQILEYTWFVSEAHGKKNQVNASHWRIFHKLLTDKTTAARFISLLPSSKIITVLHFYCHSIYILDYKNSKFLIYTSKKSMGVW